MVRFPNRDNRRQFRDVLKWHIRIMLFCVIKFQDRLGFYSSVAHSSLIVLPILPIKDAWGCRKKYNQDICYLNYEKKQNCITVVSTLPIRQQPYLSHAHLTFRG